MKVWNGMRLLPGFGSGRENFGEAAFYILRCLDRGRGAMGQPESDVDLMADYDRTRRLTLLDKAALEVEIAQTLHASVDLCDREFLEGQVRVRAEREAVVVF